MKEIKRLFPLFLAIVLCLSLTGAAWASGETEAADEAAAEASVPDETDAGTFDGLHGAEALLPEEPSDDSPRMDGEAEDPYAGLYEGDGVLPYAWGELSIARNDDGTYEVGICLYRLNTAVFIGTEKDGKLMIRTTEDSGGTAEGSVTFSHGEATLVLTSSTIYCINADQSYIFKKAGYTEEIGDEDEGSNGWRAAYAQAIRDYLDSLEYSLQIVAYLMDIDLDGTPELLLSAPIGPAGHGMLEKVYTFRDGALREIPVSVDVPEKTLFDGLANLQINGSSYSLYKNNDVSVYRLECSFRVPAGASHSYEFTGILKLSNGYLTFEDVFESAFDSPEDTFDPGIGRTYWYRGEQLGTEKEYNTQMKDWHSGWTAVQDYECYSTYISRSTTSAEIKAFLAQFQGRLVDPADAYTAAKILQAAAGGNTTPVPADAARVLAGLG